MKKIVSWILILTMLLSLSACGSLTVPTKAVKPDKRTEADAETEAETEADTSSSAEATEESKENETSPDKETEAFIIREEDLPEGTAFAYMALPSSERSCLVDAEMLAGKTVQSPEEAKELLYSFRDSIGFSDLSEFSEPFVQAGQYAANYHFTQYINGIPAEGKGISLITDGKENVTELRGEYWNPSDVDTESILSAEEACDAVRQLFETEEMQQISCGRVIFASENGKQTAWKNYVFYGTRLWLCYVSARDGSVLSAACLDLDDSAVGSGKDVDGKTVEFNTEYSNGTYLLEDAGSHIRVYDLNTTEAKVEFCVRTDFLSDDYFIPILTDDEDWINDGEGYPITRNGQEDPEHEYRLTLKDGILVTTDNGTDLYTDVHLELLFKKEAGEYFEVLSDDDNVWEDERAVSVMDRLQDIVYFWRKVLDRNSFDDSENVLVFGLNDIFRNSNGKIVENAGASAAQPFPGYAFGKITISRNKAVRLDTLAHEFTHAVIQSRVMLGGTDYKYPEASAINEGVADFFGECAESFITGECDWDHGAGRNLKDPSVYGGDELTAHPSCYQDEGWYYRSSSDLKTNHSVFAHHNSTVISHMGYLIATGDLEKPESTKALGIELAAKLFYNTFPLLWDNIGFSDYATVLYNIAVQMHRDGLLTPEQVRCVFRAMEEVGLLPVYTVRAGGSLDLKSLNNMVLTDYSIDIYAVYRVTIKDAELNLIYDWGEYHTHADFENDPVFRPELPTVVISKDGNSYYKVVIVNNKADNEDFSFILELGSISSVRRITAPFLLVDEVVNNGGRFVEHQGYVYYWQMSDESYDKNGTLGYFTAWGRIENKLMRLDPDGTTKEIFSGTGHGNIYISGGRIYTYTGAYSIWRSTDLAGGDEKILRNGAVVGAYTAGGIVIIDCPSDGNKKSELYAVDVEENYTRVSRDSFDSDDGAGLYLISDDGKAYYYRMHKTDGRHESVIAFEADLTNLEEDARYLGDAIIPIESGEGAATSAVLGKNALYVSCCVVRGTGRFYANGSLTRMWLDHEAATETLISSDDKTNSLGYPGLHYAWTGKEADPELIYFCPGSLSGAGETVKALEASMVSVMNLQTGSISPSELPLIYSSQKIAFIYRYGDDSLPDLTVYSEDGTELILVLSANTMVHEGVNVDGLTKEDGYFLKNADIVGGRAFVEFWEVGPGIDTGWRTGYLRKQAKIFEVDIEKQTMVLLYGF